MLQPLIDVPAFEELDAEQSIMLYFCHRQANTASRHSLGIYQTDVVQEERSS